MKAIGDGRNVQTDMNTMSIWIEGKKVMSRGAECTGFPSMGTRDILNRIEKELYPLYKHSVPTEKTRKAYFKALKLSELTNDDMCFGQPRYTAKARLEAFLICAVLSGAFRWEDIDPEGRMYFWRSARDRNLVILKETIKY